MMNVVFIGSGNVATVLGQKALLAGHQIIQVISRNADDRRALAAAWHCKEGELADIDRKADLYIIAVSDSAIQSLSDSVSLDKKLVVHTAGSVSIDVLGKASSNFGVLYPLQSLRKEIGARVEIPLLIDANTPETLTLLTDFAKTISPMVDIADDRTRFKLHIAAIIVNNFTNHLYALTENYCQTEHVDFSLLMPLIRETANRLDGFSPAKMQTGPAIRQDEKTIDSHLALLAGFPELKKIYQLFTRSIQSGINR
jgi:predicted short-subunit dehydrogenase-like oxidoreductase (DUF2520 family)